MKELIIKVSYALLTFLILLKNYLIYKKKVTLRFEDENTWQVSKWIWYKGDPICMQWYDVNINDVESAYSAALHDCDEIIQKHKKTIKQA